MTLDDRVKALVTEMLAAGAPSITTIHTALVTDYDYGHSYSHFYNDFRKMNFKTPEGFGKRGRKKKRNIIPEEFEKPEQKASTPKHQPSRDALIFHDPPLTSDEIAEKEAEITGRKVTGNAIRSYMERHCFHKGWKERRKVYLEKVYLEKQGEKSSEESVLNERRNAQQTLLDAIKTYYMQRALQEDKPKGYAAAYYYSAQRHQTNISLEKLEGFFEDYFAAQEGNLTKTLEELAKKQGFGTMTAQRVLKKVGLKPLGKEVISSVEKDALQRAASVAMGIIDIAYFMNTDYPFTVSYTKPYRVQRKERFGFQIGCATTKQWIGYRHASKVYQALQEGFTPEEAQILADIHPKAYDFIMQNRATIEPIIIAALQKMYNNPTHNVPYVTLKLREHLQNH